MKNLTPRSNKGAKFSIRRKFATLSVCTTALLCSACLFQSQPLQAQTIVEGPFMLQGDRETLCLVGGVSANGRYIFGSSPDISFVYDRETKKSYYPQENYRVVSVADDGTMITFVNHKSGGIISAKDKTFKAFVSPIEDYPIVAPIFASADGKYVCGNLLKKPDNHYTKPFLAIRQEDGTYKSIALEAPDKDVFNLEPQYSLALVCTNDGKYICGLQKDYSGLIDRFIVWKRQEDGSYKFNGLDDKTFFGETLPIQSSTILKYIPRNGVSLQISHDRNYLCGTVGRLNDLGDLEKKFPYIYNLREGKGVMFENITHSGTSAVDAWSDNAIIHNKITPGVGWLSYVTDPENELTDLPKWIGKKCNTDISKFYDFPAAGRAVMGYPYLSQDGKVLVTFRLDPNNKNLSNISYIVFNDNILTSTDKPLLPEVESNSYNYDSANGNLYVQKNMQAELIDMSGNKVAQKHLLAGDSWILSENVQEGLYLLSLHTGDRKSVIKIKL